MSNKLSLILILCLCHFSTIFTFKFEFPPQIPITLNEVDRIERHISQEIGIYDCMTMECICAGLDGTTWDANNAECVLDDGRALKIVRTEIRRLPDEERRKFFNTIMRMKQNGLWNRIAEWHKTRAEMPGAHSGPGFLPWHREYLKRMEIALLKMDPTVHLPYWDWTMDQHLEVPRDSVIWSAEFLGQVSDDGQTILDGPARGWITLQNVPLGRNISSLPDAVRCAISSSNCVDDRLYSAQEVEALMDKPLLSILGFADPSCHPGFLADKNETSNRTLEEAHNSIHGYVGGQMATAILADNDPVFFVHHAFTDLIWMEWRDKQQTLVEQENEFPDEFVTDKEGCGGKSNHSSHAPMLPFKGLKIKDGLKNIYQQLYSYADRPTCSMENPNCESKYLFCWLRQNSMANCVSKIKPAGNCAKFKDNVQNSCYESECIDGICRKIEEEKIIPKNDLKPSDSTENGNEFVRHRICYDSHECCPYWGPAGLCEQKNVSMLMNSWCPGTCQYDGCQLDIRHQTADCTDRHPKCQLWIKERPDECQQQELAHWMALNCAKACGKCQQIKFAASNDGK